MGRAKRACRKGGIGSHEMAFNNLACKDCMEEVEPFAEGHTVR